MLRLSQKAVSLQTDIHHIPLPTDSAPSLVPRNNCSVQRHQLLPQAGLRFRSPDPSRSSAPHHAAVNPASLRFH